jgi:ubiquitin-conjugating enzyme E2 J2
LRPHKCQLCLLTRHTLRKFPPEYPMKPPAIYMITPNGRFKTNTRLCLSMSDFHPETWNPVWSVSTILMALNSFMLDRDSTAGSIETSDTEKRRKARESMDFNCKNVLFRQLFADMTEEHLEARARQETNVPPDEVQPAPTQPALAQGVSSVTFILLSGAVCVSCVVGLWFVM